MRIWERKRQWERECVCTRERMWERECESEWKSEWESFVAVFWHRKEWESGALATKKKHGCENSKTAETVLKMFFIQKILFRSNACMDRGFIEHVFKPDTPRARVRCVWKYVECYSQAFGRTTAQRLSAALRFLSSLVCVIMYGVAMISTLLKSLGLSCRI